MAEVRILVTGGGSSGHISPAIAIIEALQQKLKVPGSPRLNLLYVGSRHGLERELITARGWPFRSIATGKLRRYLSLRNLTDMARLPVGLAQALLVVHRFRPHAVLATGGYVAVPPVLAAGLQRVPVLIHEQTVQLGLANRISSRFATRIGLAFEAARAELPAALQRRAVVTGNPVRAYLTRGDKAECMRLAGFEAGEDLPVVYVTGGSQGSRMINRAVAGALDRLLPVCRIVHQCGRQPAGMEQDYDFLSAERAQLPDLLRGRYFVAEFFRDELPHVLAAADLVIGRSGAGTVSELFLVGKPALYIPLVPTGGDEQTKNARMAAALGAARVLPQAELDATRLAAAALNLLADVPALRAMGQAALAQARPDAARAMADLLLDLARRTLTPQER